MQFNSTNKIKDDGRPWLVLIDYHLEGFHVEQFATLEEAMKAIMSGQWSTESAIAYMPNVNLNADFKAFATLATGGKLE